MIIITIRTKIIITKMLIMIITIIMSNTGNRTITATSDATHFSSTTSARVTPGNTRQYHHHHHLAYIKQTEITQPISTKLRKRTTVFIITEWVNKNQLD